MWLALVLVLLLVVPAAAQQNLGNVQVNRLFTVGGPQHSLKVPTMKQAERDSFSHENGELVDCSDCSPPGGYMYMVGAWVFVGGTGGGGTVTGTGAGQEIAVWTDVTNLTGYPGFQWDPVGNRFFFCNPDGATCRGFSAPAGSPGLITWTMPISDGTAGQVLTTSGTGQLSWSTAGSGTTSGTGTTNRLTLWTSPSTLGNSFLEQSANTITMNPGIGAPQTISAGTAPGGVGAPLTIQPGSAAPGSGLGAGTLFLQGGIGDGAGASSGVEIIGRDGPFGGPISITAGNAPAGPGGDLTLIAGNGANGGNVIIAAGDSSSPAFGGNITLTTGTGTPRGIVRMDVGKTGFAQLTGGLVFESAVTGNVGFKAPAVGGTTIYTLPTNDGTVGQCLKTDGAGALSFAPCGGGGSANHAGSIVIAGTNTTAPVTFTDLGSSIYYVTLGTRPNSGAPPAVTARYVSPTSSGFTVELSGAPGLGNSVAVDWQLSAGLPTASFSSSCAAGGRVVVADMNDSGSVTFASPMVDTNYSVSLATNPGTGAVTSFPLFYRNATINGFDFSISSAPGTGNNTTVSWIVTPSSCGTAVCASGGRVVVIDMNDTGHITFATPQADANYAVSLATSPGPSAVGSFPLYYQNVTVNGFDFAISAAPGTGKSTTVSWIVTPSSCTF
jgi:hypothetical protein